MESWVSGGRYELADIVISVKEVGMGNACQFPHLVCPRQKEHRWLNSSLSHAVRSLAQPTVDRLSN